MKQAVEGEEINFLVVGDVHGHWDQVIEGVSGAQRILKESNRTLNAVFLVGDVEAYRDEVDLAGAHVPKKYRSMGVFSILTPQDVTIPTYFIGGNHEPYVSLDSLRGTGPFSWGDSGQIYYLGRAGAQTLHGLRVAWLSGIASPNGAIGERPPGKKALGYFTTLDCAETQRKARQLRDIDLFLGHDWPSGLLAGRGNPQTAQLIEAIKPKLAVFGHMHRELQASLGGVAVHTLSSVPGASLVHRSGWWALYTKTSEGVVRLLAQESRQY